MTHNEQAINATVATMQQILERNYPHLEWRVRFTPAAPAEHHADPRVFVHARTRDFRYRCRVDRPWTDIETGTTLGLLVADLAAEAEGVLAQLAAL